MELVYKIFCFSLLYLLYLLTANGNPLLCSYYSKFCNSTNGTSTVHNNNITYCGNNGQKYQGLCRYFEASCHLNVTIVATGSNCEHKTPTRAPPTSPPPLTYFEVNLYHSIKRSIDDRLELSKARGIPPSKAKPIFAKQDHDNKVYIRSPDCWAYGLDLTPISPWNSNHGIRKAGTLISRRHLVWARHYSIPVGTTMRFVDLHDNVVERKVSGVRYVNHTSGGHESFWGRDIVVGILDRDLPDSIAFAKVMPRDLDTFRPRRDMRLPVLSTDFEEKALVTDFSYYQNSGIGLKSPDVDSIEHAYYERKIGGDSGNPSFFVINNELVLLFVFTSGGAGGGTSINHYYDEINRLMKEEGGGYQLTPANLTMFSLPGQHIPHLIG